MLAMGSNFALNAMEGFVEEFTVLGGLCQRRTILQGGKEIQSIINSCCCLVVLGHLLLIFLMILATNQGDLINNLPIKVF